MVFTGTKDIKHYVNSFIEKNAFRLKNKQVYDIPAGTGITSQKLKEVGSIVNAYDLFPDFFKMKDLSCKYCNLEQDLPIHNEVADWVFCQEGIEHMPNQLHTLREFNRILNRQGTLIVTTPNYSNLKARLSYLLTESEYFNKIMPPNELDDVWFSTSGNKDMYFGHLFLTGIQKMRTLGLIAGFRIKKLHHYRTNGTAVALFPLLYPLIWLSSYLTMRKNIRKRKHQPEAIRIYKEIFTLNTNPGVLLTTHLFIEFEKMQNWEEVNLSLHSKHTDTNFIT